MTTSVAAVTGGTGFLGGYIAAALARSGWKVRLLARRAPAYPTLTGVPLELVMGDLDDSAALSQLVRGATAVIHAAGLVKARSRQAFFTVNRDGTHRLAQAVRRDAPSARFILISSQAAREPHVSAYAASKRAGEAVIANTLADAPWVALRPCVIYGPGDAAGLTLLSVARGWLAPVPAEPELRIAMIHARDVAAAVAVLSRGGPSGAAFEIADERRDGYGWIELLSLMGAALGRSPRCVAVPDLLIRIAGAVSDGAAALSGRPSIFGAGKAREILHRDWAPDLTRQLPDSLWTPCTDLRAGLAETVAWWNDAASRRV